MQAIFLTRFVSFFNYTVMSEVNIEDDSCYDYSSTDDNEDSNSLNDFIQDLSSSLLDPSLGTCLVVLNSVFKLYEELSSDQYFDEVMLTNEKPMEPYLGCPAEQVGIVLESTFVDHFHSFGYLVEPSSLQEICDFRKHGNPKSTFLVQGIAERTTPDMLNTETNKHKRGMRNSRGWKHRVEYLQAEELFELDDANNPLWEHCIHVMPTLDIFFCCEQRSLECELLSCPFSWLQIDERESKLLRYGYLREIQHVWKITLNRNSPVTQLKCKYKVFDYIV